MVGSSLLFIRFACSQMSTGKSYAAAVVYLNKHCTRTPYNTLWVVSSHGGDMFVIAHQVGAIVQGAAHGGELVTLPPVAYKRTLTIDPSTRHTLGTQVSVATV